MEHRLEFAIDLSQRAGARALRYFRDLDALQIESKGHQDLVSNADREVESFIRAALRREFPEDGVIGEEDARVLGVSGFDWVIDPIDGTANFVRGIPAWCVVIACAENGVTKLGAIHEPSTGETFSARRGAGAFLNGRPIHVSSASRLSEGSMGVGFSGRAEAQNVVPLIRDLIAEGGVFFRNASGALMLAYVGAGRLLGYLEEHMNAWDCLAGLLIIEEAGGRILPLDPAAVLDRGALVVAAGPNLYDKTLELAERAFNR